MKVFRTLTEGLNAVLFPTACQCCGDVQVEDDDLLCAYCIEHLFEDANPERLDACTDVFLPEYIGFQDALWKYDKGGHLQELLIKLKYHGMAKLGVQLGRLLGARLSGNPACQKEEACILVPVPLHPARRRKRGYNQAESIATGVSKFTGIPVADEEVIIRTRNTRTQTGFTLNRRMQNLKQAFRIQKPEVLAGKIPIIVDDVFTTGTTTFELAATLKPCCDQNMGVITVAMA